MPTTGRLVTRGLPTDNAMLMGLAAAVLMGGCSYTPTRDDFTNPPDWLDPRTDPPTAWYRDTTDEGFDYRYAYHPQGLDVCKGRAGCTSPDGEWVVLAPGWYWRGRSMERAHVRAHEECHVNAIQARRPDRCDS